MPEMSDRKSRPVICIVSENYWPEFSSTAQLMTELAEALASDLQIEVLTTRPKYNAAYPARSRVEVRNGVTVRRLWSTSFSKRSSAGRVANWLTFLAAVCTALLQHRHAKRTYLFVTNPPTAPWAVPLAKALGSRAFIVVHDLYPDLAEAIGAVRKGGLAAKVFDVLNRWAFRRASGLVALGQDMRERLQDKIDRSTGVTVIPNWADGQKLKPLPKTSSAFATRNGLLDQFVFLYAGNLGLFQDLETLAEAVVGMEIEGPQPVLVFVGEGGKRRAVEAYAQRSERVRVFDYVPYEALADLYAAADVGLIALEPGVEKTNLPSKTYRLLAAGKPFLAVCQNSTDLEALASEGCGFCVPNDVEKVRAAMIKLMAEKEATEEMGAKARVVFEERFSLEIAAEHYRRVLLGGQERAAA